MRYNYDCATCAKRDTCESAVPGTFCLEWRSGKPDGKKQDPNPGGWSPEED